MKLAQAIKADDAFVLSCQQNEFGIVFLDHMSPDKMHKALVMLRGFKIGFLPAGLRNDRHYIMFLSKPKTMIPISARVAKYLSDKVALSQKIPPSPRPGHGPDEERALNLLGRMIPRGDLVRYVRRGFLVASRGSEKCIIRPGHTNVDFVRPGVNGRLVVYKQACVQFQEGLTPTDDVIMRLALLDQIESHSNVFVNIE